MQKIVYPNIEKTASLLQRPAMDIAKLEATVQSILLAVRQEGDIAVRRFTEKFDKAQLTELQLSAEALQARAGACPQDLRTAIEVAATNIRKFHEAQREVGAVVETMPGVRCWRKSVAIDKVGLYIPGGTAPLFSSVLMLALPAKIAGCGELVLCTPPDAEGQIHPAIAFAALLSGVDKVFLVGGVQAIGAMAYGTESVPKVDKIFGPGNQYVTMAKQLVSKQDVAFDMPAGPS